MAGNNCAIVWIICVLLFPYLSVCRVTHLTRCITTGDPTTQCQLSSSSATTAADHIIPAMSSSDCDKRAKCAAGNRQPENHTLYAINLLHKDAAAANEKIKFLPYRSHTCRWKRSRQLFILTISKIETTEKSETFRALIPSHRQNWAMRMNFSSTHPSEWRARETRWQMFAKFLT